MKDVLKSLWLNHKKKLVALLVMILTSIGLLSEDVRQAIHEATAPKVEAPLTMAIPVTPESPSVPNPKVEEKK
ncbi:MAG: hypothetical protein ACK58T_38260 [Phycisphaerae bacterium]|jgi:hypothetical protein